MEFLVHLSAMHHEASTSTDDNSLQTQRWWVYLLECRRGVTYAGVALDVRERFELHIAGKAAKFTRANPPLRVLGARSFESKSEALRAEYALKQLSPAAKREWATANPPAITAEGP